ncbi:ComF family protein [Pandoraea terrae]|uniref:ComF family protein n=1 Tax=Pandoraea terrae TaxID=1537710 RepID=UPI0012424188|nr:ComF family protein [Pandoraea terrae]
MPLALSFTALTSGFLRIALPEHCAVCGVRADRQMCGVCAQVFDAGQPAADRPIRCLRCAAAMQTGAANCRTRVCDQCLAWSPAFDHSLALADYRPPLDRLMMRLKFHGRLPLAREFGLRLADALGERGIADDTLLVPVPLARERLVTRGFNQAWEIARVAARRLQRPADAHCLRRVRETAQQSRLERAARQRNLRTVFAAGAAVRDRAVVLVDDVMTTGATCHEAADALKQAGAREVTAAVVLRTRHS